MCDPRQRIKKIEKELFPETENLVESSVIILLHFLCMHVIMKTFGTNIFVSLQITQFKL